MRSLAAYAALAVALTFNLAAAAAEEEDESMPANSAVTAELQRQIALPPPASAGPREQCVFLHKRGTAHLRLGMNDQALADLNEALALKQRGASELWCDRWRLQIDIKSAIHANADWLVLADYAKSIGEEYRVGNAWRYSESLYWLVDANVFLGRLREAEQAFQRAADLLPELRQHKAWPVYGSSRLGRHVGYTAWMQELRGNFAEAERHRRQALRQAGEYLDTIRANRSAEHHDVRAAHAVLTTRKRLLAGILATQGKTGEAEILVREALHEALSRSGKHTHGVASLINALGLIKQQQGRIDEALRLRMQAVSALEASGARSYSTLLGDMRAMVGFLLGVQNRWAEALEVFNQRDRGLRSNPVQFARTGSNNINWAMALLRNGQVDEAERMLRSMVAWNLKKPFADPLYLAHLRGYHALALVAGGKDDAALAQFREAFPVMLRQAETDNSSDNGGFVRQYRLRLIAEGYLDLLARRAVRNAAAPDQELIAEAFRVAEAARGSSVQTAIANSLARASLPDATLADLARREQDAANQISSLNALLVRLASSPESQRLDKAIAEIRGEVARIEARHAELRRELAQRYPAYAELIAPKAPSPAEVQKALQPNEAAVALLVTERRTYVWTVTPTRIAFRIAELSREQADKQVSALLAAFDLSGGKLPHYDAGAARELYRILLAPDEKLWEGASVLNVIVNGRLGQLPFAVLLTGDPDKPSLAEQPWLIGKIALVQQPSAGTLVSLRAQVRKQAERRPFVGFGDPTFVAREARKPAGTRSIRNLSVAKGAEDAAELPAPSRQAAGAPTDGGRTILLRGFDRLPQLPETADELIEIGRILGADPKSDLFLGARATEAKVKGSDLSHYGVVAFATHGLVPGELQGLDQPSLAMANPVLSGDKDNDGFLTMSEVLGLKLDADWVVLSACNTASGDGRNEEAISGLGRAFFFAGTRRLLLTYWPVETVSASLLTTELFKRQKAQPGESKAEALRHSMLRLMASSNEYGHPAFWAPYGLVGDAMK